MTSAKPTLKTVAQAAEVSLPTVSQVMRGVGRISSNTRKRVLDAAMQVGYVPDVRASTMRTGQSNEIGIIVHHLSNRFNAELIAGASDVLEEYGYFLSIMDARGNPQRLEKLVKTTLSKSSAGLLWVPAEQVNPHLVSLIMKQRIATVSFLRELAEPQFPSLKIANVDALQQATKYLIKLGHTNIAFVGGVDQNQTRIRRIEGYQSTMNQMLGQKGTIIDLKETKHSGFDYAKELVTKHTDITAVVCNGDEIAIGLCLGLQRIGITPGKEISVIGFDNIDEAELITPALTTLSISPQQFGQNLATLLIEQIQGNTKINQLQQWVRARLIVRKTTGKVNPVKLKAR